MSSNKRQPLLVRFPNGTYEKLREKAESTNVSMNEFVVSSVESALVDDYVTYSTQVTNSARAFASVVLGATANIDTGNDSYASAITALAGLPEGEDQNDIPEADND